MAKNSVVVYFAIAGWGVAWSGWGQARQPAFATYPVATHYRGPNALPQLRPGTAAWQFRTRIRTAATQPPNFAGHYVLATWGCGLECVSYAIIDAKTGEVYFDNVTICCWSPAVPASFEPVRGQLASRLLVFTGMLNEHGANERHYYIIANGLLQAVTPAHRPK